LHDARQLTRWFEPGFDKILLDAPCSGEGLISLSQPKDLNMWSPAQIKRLQQLQKRLLTQAWQLLKPGGRLVYSTCTIAPEENEAVISYALRTFDDAVLLPVEISLPNRVPAVLAWRGKTFDGRVESALRLQPSKNIEAFFVAVLEKQPDSVSNY
jgi:16S rRNA C967 or C1407 C5-methylase (RsmB/RsmF family)